MRHVSFALACLLAAQICTPLCAPLWAVEKRQVIVLPFRNLSQQASDQWLAESFSESLIMGMGRADSLRMIERGEMQSILKEQAFMQTFLADSSQAPQLGKMLGAEYIVIGNFQRIGNQLQANVRLVNVETGEIDGSSLVQVQGSADDLFALQARLAQQLLIKLSTNQAAQIAEVQASLQQTRSPQAHEYYVKGLSLVSPWMSDRELVQARDWFQQAVQADKQYVQAYAGLAEVYARRALAKNLYLSAQADDAAQALHYAQRAYDLDSESSETYYALSLAYEANQQAKPAQQAAEIAALKSNQPRFIRRYLDLAFPLLGSESRIQEIEQSLQRFVIDAGDPLLQEFLSGKYVYYLITNPTSDHSDKIKAYQNTFTQNPHLVMLGLNLASMYLVQGNLPAFEQTLNSIEQANSDNALALYLSGIYLSNLKQQEQRAVRLINRAIALQPETAVFYQLRADLYQGKLNQPAAALADIQKSLSLATNDSESFYRAARSYLKLQRPQEAEVAIRKAIALNAPAEADLSKSIRFQGLLGKLLSQQGRLKEALAAYGMALSYTQKTNDPTFRLVYLRERAEVLLKLKDYTAALADTKQALEISDDQQAETLYKLAYLLTQLQSQPQDPRVLNDIGQLWLQQDDLEQAVFYLEQAKGQAPENDAIAYNLGLAYQAQAKWALAEKAFVSALRLNPEHIKARLSAIKLVYQQGQLDSAQAQLQALLKQQPDLIGGLELQALLYEVQNQGLQAQAVWQQILKLDPTHFKARREIKRLETRLN